MGVTGGRVFEIGLEISTMIEIDGSILEGVISVIIIKELNKES